MQGGGHHKRADRGQAGKTEPKEEKMQDVISMRTKGRIGMPLLSFDALPVDYDFNFLIRSKFQPSVIAVKK